ncbi:hypothetical protein B5F53_15375 [Blautia sp. An249]|uniref:hypothetical protein n=1 Tax=Blautia sp. An249 TaxID=1965603 RepID=UPI000B3B0057|nr:hypothetical protein [Blautia sp. An249]OUO76953.1 hypothetical protein B5F53_15375 [Blautia sp. An249]
MKQERNKSKKDFNKAVSFIEDLCWLLDSQKNTNYSEVLKTISDLKEQSVKAIEPSTDDLIGILPQLLTDKALFTTNKSLAQFSDEILGIEILNWHKRSRYEMIGVIICKVQESPTIATGISKYVLTNIMLNKEQIREYQKEIEKSNNQFLWNEAIHKIVEMEKNE